jgi:hypothetical protein
VLPELADHRSTFSAALEISGAAAERSVYLVALVGLSIFYGLERAAKISRKRSAEDRVGSRVLWLHIGSFALYNVLIGYLLLHREATGWRPLLIYFFAMALHFVTSDFGLREDQKQTYDSVGRWVTAASVLMGWALGLATTVPEITVGFLFAFLAGGVVLNVLKEELPEERRSRFWPFAAGGAGYAALLIFT